MLHLQRASAGSGKTYMLTKQFIVYALSSRNRSKKTTLASAAEIVENIKHILAITFTNKATNEMKERIVEKLYALSRISTPGLSLKEINKTDYLEDLKKIFNADNEDISEAARAALTGILDNYSEFKVSTIDSFFQELLRTFTYEANINDSFQLETDKDFIISTAIESLLHEIDNEKEADPFVRKWLISLMKNMTEKNPRWNIFAKSEVKGSLYSSLKEVLQNIDKENFKAVRGILQSFFAIETNRKKLEEGLQRLEQLAVEERKEKFEAVKRAADKITTLVNSTGYEDALKYCNKNFLKNVLKVSNYTYDAPVEGQKAFKPFEVKDTVFNGGKNPTGADEINEAAHEFYNAALDWLDLSQSPLWAHFQVYAPLMPYIVLLMTALKNAEDFLGKNNIVQLADTGTILRKIIGEDDTSFVYERLGSFIDHYLIDEFQDTSEQQWNILKPLVQESDSQGKDNLIIGDAKQSIYRFRNADPSLITTKVPMQFPLHRKGGITPEENVNWRSKGNVVKFNNYFFSNLACRLHGISESEGNKFNFKDLYSNVVQQAHHKEDRGYVELNFKEDPSAIPPLISELIERGYRPGDIAVIVNRRSEGKEIINELISYNSGLNEGERPIEFISEESLTLGSSEAVEIIVGVLRKLATGIYRNEEEDEDNSGEYEKKKALNHIRDKFMFFSKQHPELGINEKIESFMTKEDEDDGVALMLSDMKTTVLPAIVEATVNTFIPATLRESQAIFISSFQDAMLDFCTRFPADPASFIEWWDSKGKNISISSPEGTDAVQIMTVHKSKGLEFKCVILPYASESFRPSPFKEEWHWVEPAAEYIEIGLPPVLPVILKKDLLSTVHAPLYREYVDKILMDRLNANYVAFTRAVDELYVFTAEEPKKDTLGKYILEILTSENEREYNDDEKDFIADVSQIEFDEENNRYIFGKKTDPENSSGDESISSEKEDEKSIIIKSYESPGALSLLHFVNSELPEVPDPSGAFEDEEDPRSEGSLLHAVMQRITVAEDLHKAILKLKTLGLVNRNKAAEWEDMLGKALKQEVPSKWFDKDWRVLNERSIWGDNDGVKRPDRIIISPDNSKCIIIDYKFGEVDNKNRYLAQVRRYMDLVSKALEIKDIEGYVWFPKKEKIYKA